MWTQPRYVRMIERLASFSRFIVLDKRGTGLSDRFRDLPTLETRVDDLRAVLDAIGSERAVLFGGYEGGQLTITFAATYPERTAALVLYNAFARAVATPDYPWGAPAEEWHRQVRSVAERWGTQEFANEYLRAMDPALADDEDYCRWHASMMRYAMSPGAAAVFHRMVMDTDVRHVLPAIRVPTLVLYREDYREHGRFLAERIPTARAVEFAGRGILAVGPARAVRRDRALPRRPGWSSAAGSRPRHDPLHRHRRLDPQGGRARRYGVAGAARSASRAHSRAARSLPRDRARHRRGRLFRLIRRPGSAIGCARAKTLFARVCSILARKSLASPSFPECIAQAMRSGRVSAAAGSNENASAGLKSLFQWHESAHESSVAQLRRAQAGVPPALSETADPSADPRPDFRRFCRHCGNKKPAVSSGFEKRMNGLEPSTFCMASRRSTN